MSLNWDLNSLYSSFESKEFVRDWASLPGLWQEFEQWAEKNFLPTTTPEKVVFTFYEKLKGVYTVISKLNSYIHLTLATDTANETAQKYAEQMAKLSEFFTIMDAKYLRWLSAHSQEPTWLESPVIAPYRYDVTQALQECKYLLTDREELLLKKLHQTGSSAWSRLQNNLLAQLMVDYTDENGETKALPLTVVRNKAFDANPLVRKLGYQAECKAYPQIAESVATALNQIKGELLTELDWRGYPSYMAYVCKTHRLQEKTLDTLIAVIQESLPNFHAYFHKKATWLGHKNGLPVYDLLAPVGTMNREFDYNRAKDLTMEVFASFDPQMEEMGKRAFSQGWIDVEPRKGKRGGAFCSGVYSLRQSRVLMNFDGSLENVITLCHELGHAYHNEQMFPEGIMHMGSPLPLAETASTFNESLLLDYLMKTATPEESLFLLDKKVNRSATIIVDIYSRFLFEKRIMDERKNVSVPTRLVSEYMTEAQKQAFGDSLDYAQSQPYAWINKPHYYMTGVPFYNFPYSFGHLFSMGLYAMYQREGKAFIPKYKQLLSICGKANIEDIAESIGIDVTKPDFWYQSVELIKQDIANLNAVWKV